jgi:hypothetical protein
LPRAGEDSRETIETSMAQGRVERKIKIMNDREQNASTPEIDPQAPTQQESRRRLIRGGLVGTPLILTLASRPVLGCDCVAPSRAVSGNTSRPGVTPQCGGRNVSYWKTYCDSTTRAKRFNDSTCFPAGTQSFSKRQKMVNKTQTWATVGDVLDAKDTLQTSSLVLNRQFVAALLNIRGGFVPKEVMDETTLRAMWTSLASKGNYSPFAGMKTPWTLSDCSAYLHTNGIGPIS